MVLLQWWFVVGGTGALYGLVYQVASPIPEGSPLMTRSPPRLHLLTQSSWGLGFQQVKGRICYCFFP